MTGFTKLFSSILDSTIWDEDCATRILWITMLAMVNRDSQVLTSVKNLSLRARLTVNDVNDSLEKLLAPDPESKSREHEGRRIVRIDGGWQILNYEKYRNKRDRADYMRKYMRNYRAVNQNGEIKVNPIVSQGKPLLADSRGIEHTNTTPYNPPSNVNFVNQLIEEQNFKSKIQNPKPRTELPRNCMMPGCENPVDPKYKPFCSQACKDYGDFLNSKYGPSA